VNLSILNAEISHRNRRTAVVVTLADNFKPDTVMHPLDPISKTMNTDCLEWMAAISGFQKFVLVGFTSI
jgi:hypothetical protein